MKTYPVGSPAAMRLEPSLIDRAGEDAERERDAVASVAEQLGCSMERAKAVLEEARWSSVIEEWESRHGG